MTIHELLWKIFPPFEYKATKNWIDYYTPIGDNVFKNIANEQARIKATIRARDYSKTVYSIRCNNQTAQQVALVLLYNVSFFEATSGGNHIYSGILSEEGKSFLKLWFDISREMVKLGFSNEEEHEQNYKNALMHIKRMG